MSADSTHGSDNGSMDITEHQKTWAGFMTLVKWIAFGCVLLLIFLAIFRTH